MGRRTRTTFRPGCRPGPGRPRGARDRHPRGLLKALVLGLITQNEKKVRETLKKNLGDQERVVRVIELAAKLNKELGIEATTAPTSVIINYRGPLDPRKFRAKTERRLREAPEDE